MGGYLLALRNERAVKIADFLRSPVPRRRSDEMSIKRKFGGMQDGRQRVA